MKVANERKQSNLRGIGGRAALTLAALGVAAVVGGCAGASPLTSVRTTDGFTIAVDLETPAAALEKKALEKKAPLVVLCHQQKSDRTAWDPVVPKLLERGFAVLRLDHRGFGESTKEVASPLELAPKPRDSFHEDILAAIRAASRRSGVDASRIVIVASGFSDTYAARAARLEPRVKGLVFLAGTLLSEDEDFLIAHPDLPVFFAVATNDVQGAQTLRQHAARIRGPRQELIELGPIDENDANDWRGTDGLREETGLADLIVWKIEGMLSPNPSP